MNPVFFIITVTYNASQWIEQTIRSIGEQTYSGIRHIIIDGGSTDGTVEIIKKYEAQLYYWISEPDNGLYDAMNKGLKAASGDYVWFINAGDRLHATDTVEKLVAGLPGNLPDVIYGETCIIDDQGHSLGLRRLCAPEKLTWKSFRMGMLVCHQSFVVKTDLAPEYAPALRLVADYDWCIRCLKKATLIHNTRLVLSDFLEAGMSTAQRKKSLKERYRVMCKYYGTFSTRLLHLWFALRFYSAKWFSGRV